MLTATHLVVLATLASLAHTVSLRDGGEEPLSVKCCVANKALPAAFQAASPACIGSFLDPFSEPTDFAAEVEKTCLVECIMGEHGLLNEDKSIKEDEFKEFYKGKADPIVRTAVQAALDKCFESHNKKADKGACKSGAQPLVGCIQDEILKHCPKSMWNGEKAECKEAMKNAEAAESKELE